MSRTEAFAVVDGKKIFYREEADADARAPKAVLIHGNTGSSLWFDRVMKIEGIHSYAPDMPNFGRSDHIEESDIDTYARFVGEFISEVVKAERVVLVGHSLGGGVAMSLALQIPSRIAGLMLVDSCGPGGLTTPEEYYPVIEQYKTNRELLKSALASVAPHMTDNALLETLVDEARQMNPDSFAGNARALARFDCSDRKGRLDAPVLVVRGADDVLITDEMARRTSEAFSKGTLETIPDVGHSLMVEDPVRFIELVRGFVRQVAG